MYRFKLSAILLSLLARLGLAEPNYSILDESSNRWLPDDTLLTGLNTIYNSFSQGLQDKDKKRKPMTLAAAIVEFLSSDLTEEQDKLNTALNIIDKTVTSKLQDEETLKYKLINDNEVTTTSHPVEIEDNLKKHNFEDLNKVKDNIILRILLDNIDIKNNAINEQYYNNNDTDRQIVEITRNYS